MIKSFQVAIAITMMCGGLAQAQCGCDSGAANNCGRGISQSDAAGLWAGYCTESCYDHSSNRLFGNRSRGCGNDCSVGSNFTSCGCDTGCDTGCSNVGNAGGGRLRSRLGNRGCDTGCGDAGGASRGGLRSRLGNHGGLFNGNDGCGCGCDQGCFGYPTGGCGCGCDDSGGSNFGGLRARLGSRRCGGCNECGGDGFLSRLLHHHGNRCGRSGRLRGLFSRSSDCCGSNGAYFGESVGYEYGNAGIQSYVSGCGGNNATAPASLMPTPGQTLPATVIDAPFADGATLPGIPAAN